MTNEMTLEEVREVGIKRTKKTYSEDNGNTLIKAINSKAIDFEDGFVADNVKMLAIEELLIKNSAKQHSWDYCGTHYEKFAYHIANEMEGNSGASFQYEVEDIVEMILSMVEWAQSRSSKIPS